MATEDQKQSRNTAFLFLSAIASGGIGGFLGNVLTKLLVDDEGVGVAVWPWIVAILFAGIGAGTLYYWTIFGYGAFEKGSQQRERYNRLRTGLGRGGRIGPAYERMLRATLDAVDGFFGDKDKADRTLFPNAFGLRERAPLWTAQSYNRCLLVALIYPIAMIFTVWTMSGHVGPAEASLGLPSKTDWWRRALTLISLVAMAVCYAHLLRSENARNILLRGALVFVAGIAMIYFVGIGGIVALGAVLGEGIWAVSVLAIGTLASTIIFSESSLFSIIIVTIFSVAAIFLIFHIYNRSAKRDRLGLLLLSWTSIVFVITALSPMWAASHFFWVLAGPALLFLVLLTLVNAPFDWITLGLTRALLRRGLELGGWWPLAFGLIDLFAAAAVVAALSVAALWSVQLFGHFTALGSGEPVLEVEQVLKALADPVQRTAPEYWWLYAMLFSTLIPSIVNVALGALSIMRGIPGLHIALARRMKVGKAVLESDRLWMAPLLTLQAILSIAIGTVVMLGLLWAILAWELPLMGLNLVAMLQALAAEDLPGRLLSLLGVL